MSIKKTEEIWYDRSDLDMLSDTSISNLNKINNFEQKIYNQFFKKLLSFNQLEFTETYKYFKDSKGIGQIKLYLFELFFINNVIEDIIQNGENTRDYTILYIGSGPGNHIPILINILRDYNFKWELYDKTKHDNRLFDLASNQHNKIKIHSKYFTDIDIMNYHSKKIIFISDIRSIPKNNEPITKELIDNYKLQNDIVRKLNPEYTSIKWRCPFPDKDFEEFEILNGLECLQIFTSKYSTELRIIACKPYTFRNVTLEKAVEYEEKMFYYNTKIRNKIFEEDQYYMIIDSLNSKIIDNLKRLGYYNLNDLRRKIYIGIPKARENPKTHKK